jgi:hypothetical protein
MMKGKGLEFKNNGAKGGAAVAFFEEFGRLFWDFSG